jgi:hypothetical protein
MRGVLFFLAIAIGGLSSPAGGAMPVPNLVRSGSQILPIDYTCGDGKHFTNQGCVVDQKPPQASAQKKPPRQVRKKPKRHSKPPSHRQ